jgi:hypothetical protein
MASYRSWNSDTMYDINVKHKWRMSLVCQPFLRLTECASELALCNEACVQRWFRTRDAQVFHKFHSHLKVLGAGRVTGSTRRQCKILSRHGDMALVICAPPVHNCPNFKSPPCSLIRCGRVPNFPAVGLQVYSSSPHLTSFLGGRGGGRLLKAEGWLRNFK